MPTLSSIYSQGCSNDLFEVVVADNGAGSDLESRIAGLEYPNLKYVKSQAQGFLNIIFSLQQGTGLYRKMLNHRSLLTPGSLQSMIGLVDELKDTRPVLYMSDANLKVSDVCECGSIDSFVSTLNYWCSWSAGIGVWADDIDRLESVHYDRMFPNTSLLLDLRPEGPFYIWNRKYQQMQDETGKGGYNLFRTFAVGFLDIIRRMQEDGRVSHGTFLKVRKGLYGFLKETYRNVCVLHNPNTFILTGIKESMSVYYSRWHYYYMVLWSYSIGLVKCILPAWKKRHPEQKVQQ